MTTRFNEVYESIIHETLVGSKKRNKKPAMGRKGGKSRDLAHARPMPRQIKKHAAHIRPTGKTTGNETGVHSKRPDSKPVYQKNGVKPMANKSQRKNKSTKGKPYSSDHGGNGTRLNLADRRNKLIKDTSS